MKHAFAILTASGGVFIGSLISDVLLGDGIQREDIHQAVLVAAIAAVIQYALSRRNRD